MAVARVTEAGYKKNKTISLSSRGLDVYTGKGNPALACSSRRPPHIGTVSYLTTTRTTEDHYLGLPATHEMVMYHDAAFHRRARGARNPMAKLYTHQRSLPTYPISRRIEGIQQRGDAPLPVKPADVPTSLPGRRPLCPSTGVDRRGWISALETSARCISRRHPVFDLVGRHGAR